MVLCDVRSIEEGKCSSCIGGAFKARLTWVLENMRNNGEKSIADAFEYETLLRADRRKFGRLHKDKSTAQLTEAIRHHVTIRRGTQSMQSHMDMRDEDELRVKYVDNPDKVAAIIKHAYSFYCPIRKCRLWADPENSISTPMIRPSINKEQILNLDTNNSANGTKRQKTEQAPPVESDEQWVFEWDEPGLKPVDLIKLKEFLEKMGEGVSHLGALVEEPGAEDSFLIV